MEPVEFIAKWKASELTERAAAHSHFNDLCALLDEQTPTDADRVGTHYCFERGVTKTSGGKGWADVWKRECFAWEYKGKHKDLTAAFVQLQRYAIALENPPLLVVCDFDRIRIHTNWTNSVSQIYEYTLDDLRDAQVRQTIKCLWADPEQLKPGKTRAQLTEEAAAEFAALAQRLRQRDQKPEIVAHFINRLVFCMFAEDAGLLPDRMFKRMLERAKRRPSDFVMLGSDLFRAMANPGGRVGFEEVDWFNGGLFDDDTAVPLNDKDIALVQRVSELNWSEIDTSIFGTLFERGLDPDKRSQLGAHYTDEDKIRQIIEPVITRPLLAEWSQIKGMLAALNETAARRRRGPQSQPNLAVAAYRSFMERLRTFRVLDPACGSGNFLYVALLALKDIEHQVAIEAEALGVEREFPHIGPEAVLGIEINPYAAELARITVWIGEIQWMRRNGFNVSRDPILKPLSTIECRDAVLNDDGTRASWPRVNVIVGNPPFLGETFMRNRLGSDYTETLRTAYSGRVPGGADLVCYWFGKAGEAIGEDMAARAGLVATNSIRGGANRVVLDKIVQDLQIFDAWSDEEWTVDGTAVRVSLVSVAQKSAVLETQLNGRPVTQIHADLTTGNTNLTLAARLPENAGVCFEGCKKYGPFDVPGDVARRWLTLPTNPNGRSNSDVVRPWLNAMDIVRRTADRWVVDFNAMSAGDAALFEAPFAHVDANVRPVREKDRNERTRVQWWQFERSRPDLLRAIKSLERYIVTPVVAKHRVFVWVSGKVLPSNLLDVIARNDDTTFGILHSRFHEAWALGLCTWLGVGNDPRYTPTTTFETFPFPEGLAPDRDPGFYASDARAQNIAAAARRLDELRSNWLNPSNLTRSIPETVPGYPDRVLPVDDAAAVTLKTRTLTNLYNDRPAWLVNAHRDLDDAVAVAYGWSADISEEDALAHLLEMNLARSGTAPTRRRPPQRLQREPELPPMPITGGRTAELTAELTPVEAETPVAEPARRTPRRRTKRSTS
jgi:type II restriction/modification system DNA methylase subunit YeeA